MLRHAHASRLALSIAAISLPYVQLPVVAKEPDYRCYITNSSGRVVNLSAICGSQIGNNSPETAFLQDFRSLAMQYSKDVGNVLNIYITKYATNEINGAKLICGIRRAGKTRTQLERWQQSNEPNPSPGSEARRKITNTLAVKYFCPEVASQ